jgi:hypothetical protein
MIGHQDPNSLTGQLLVARLSRFLFVSTAAGQRQHETQGEQRNQETIHSIHVFPPYK